MNIQQQTINNDCVLQVGYGQAVVNCDIATTERGGVSRILSVNCDACATNVETVVGQANVSGRVNYRILYLDDEGKVSGLDYFCEFDQSVTDERIDTSRAVASLVVVDTDCRTLQGNIRLQAVVDIRLYQIVSHTDQIVTDTGCEQQTQTIQSVSLAPLGENSFEVVEEVDSGCNIDRILMFSVGSVLTDSRPTADGTQVCGQVMANVVFLSDDNVVVRHIPFDFAEELDITGEVDLRLGVKSSRLVLTGDEGSNILRVEVVLCVSGYNVQRTDVVAVTDAFAPDCDLVPDGRCFLCRRPIGRFVHRERLSTQINATDDMPVIRKLLSGTVNRVNVAGWIAEPDRVVAEGVAVIGLLYLTDEGQLTSAEVDVPFSVPFAAQGVTCDSYLDGDALAVGIDAVLRGQQVDVTVQLLLSVNAYAPQKVCYVGDYTAKPVDSGNQSVISVYFAAPSDTLWDIARRVRVAPSELLALNPELETPSDTPRRVIIFRHRDLQ